MKTEDQIKVVTGHGKWHIHGIDGEFDEIAVSDGPHGLRKQAESVKTNNDSIKATCFPTASALACSFDPELTAKVAEAIADEALAEDVSVVLGPGVNMKRSPLCGRNFEYFSEDPYLAGTLAASYVKAMQEKGVGTSLKHYAANSQETHRMSANSAVDERALREIYLSAFERVVKEAGPASVMASYNRINGYYACENKHLLRDILKGEWGYKGVVVSDWGACTDLPASIEAGMDLEMPDSHGYHTKHLKEAVDSGKMDMDALKEAVDRIADMSRKYKNKGNYPVPADKEALLEKNHEIALEAEKQCAVLLSNDGILPIEDRNKEIILVGELASNVRFQGGGSSHINPYRLVDLKDALTLKGYKVSYVRGYDSKSNAVDNALEEEAVKAVYDKNDAIVIFCGGLTDITEGEGYDRKTLELPDNQKSLYQRIRHLSDKLVFVSFGGSPYNMAPMKDANAILQMYLGGQAVMEACSALLSGEANPCGKLAETYPISIEDTPSFGNFGDYDTDDVPYLESLFIGYRFYDRYNKDVLYPFGYGLSYSDFYYSDLVIDGRSVSWKVTNNGSRAGAEVCQLYVVNPDCNYLRAVKELRAYKKVYLEAGESKRVTVELEDRSFQIYDTESGAYITPSGDYGIEVSSSSRDVRLTGKMAVDGVSYERDDREALPGYFGNFNPTLEEFEKLYGGSIGNFTDTRPGEYNMYSSLKKMAKVTPKAKALLWLAKQAIYMMNRGTPKDDPEVQMMIEFMQDAPIDSLVGQSEGLIKYSLAESVVRSANKNSMR